MQEVNDSRQPSPEQELEDLERGKWGQHVDDGDDALLMGAGDRAVENGRVAH